MSINIWHKEHGDIELLRDRQSCFSTRVDGRSPRQSLIATSSGTSANRVLQWTVPACFRNAPTVRNPTHRAVTNATFTSGCVHGHRAWFRRLCSSLVSTRLSSVDLASPHVQRSVPRPSSALRSSISSEGSLLFVVCPSRISTHSVSIETRYRIHPPSFPFPQPFPPPLSSFPHLPRCSRYSVHVVLRERGR